MRPRACLALPLVVVGLLVSHPGRVAARTVLLMPEVYPDAPVRPLLWVSSPPRHEEYAYSSAAGQVDCDLYLPQGGGRHGTVILYTGAFGLRRAPAFVQFAEALARSGAVVLVPESTALRAGDIRAEEVDTLLQAVSYLRARPEVDPSRVGIFGFSAGGSLVLLAAETELGRQQIAFVNIFGAYYDAGDLLRQVAEDRIEADGGSEDWEPDP